MRVKLALILLGVTLISGCTVKEEIKNEPPKEIKQEVTFNENQLPYDMYGEITKTNEDIYKLYETVDRTNLKYSHDNDLESYSYEYDGGIAVTSPLQSVESINDKKFKNILQAFSFASEINPANIPYDEAIELVKKVLPDDIKLKSKNDYLDNNDVGASVLHFSSSKGNFAVFFTYGYGEDGVNYDTNSVAGITYLKEIEV